MHEPEFYNNTPFEAQILPFLNRRGWDSRLVVIKASYALGTGRERDLLQAQRPLRLGDEPWGDPEVADNRFPTDLCEFKPGTDFLVAGHALSPLGRPLPYIDVAVSIADRSRTLRAYGARHWALRVRQVGLSAPEPAERVPLCWQLAYGGLDRSQPDKPLECKENPVGRGVSRDPVLLHGQPAPQIEDPAQPLHAPNQAVRPVGLGPLGPNFEPRRSRAGTYDKHWLDEIHPAKPPDYDQAFEHVAQPELVFERPLRGGERGGVQGMTPEGRLLFEVPVERPFVEWTIDGKSDRSEPHLDTVIVDTDEQVMELVWRVCIPAPLKLRRRFSRVEVFRKKVIGT